MAVVWGCWRVWDVNRIMFGQPVLVRCSSHEWSKAAVREVDSFREGIIMFWEARGVRNHIEVRA